MSLKFALLLTITFAAFSASFFSPFVFDDDHYVLGPETHGTVPIHVSGSRSLTLISYRLNYLFGGDDPVGYHAVNFAIHLLNGWLVWRLASLLVGDALSIWIAALFLLHPLQSQSVIYISARSELLATAGILASVLCLAKSKWLGACVFALLGILSKETALVIPALWCVVAIYGRKQSLRHLVRIAGLGTLAVLLHPSAQNHLARIAQNIYSIQQQAWAVVGLASKVVPVGLTIDHDFSNTGPGALLILVFIGTLAVCLIETKFCFGIVWALILFIPHIIGGPAGYLAEHHAYAPFFGLALSMGVAAQYLKGLYGRRNMARSYVQGLAQSSLRAQPQG